jgi:CBS domain-containing protein
MTRAVVTVPPEADLVQGTRQLLARPYGCVPVLAGGQLVGIITAIDVLRGVLMDLGGVAARIPVRAHIPTVSLALISLVASSCGYYTGQIEHRAAQSFAGHVATQRGLAKCLHHCHPPCAQPVVPMRERHCRRPRLTPRRGTDQAPSRNQGPPGGAHGRSNAPIPSPFHGMRCPPVCPLFASWPWLLHAGCSLETVDMTVY